ncbi:MAG: alpha-hydroxy-acid oxidizing protein [Candidatus Koribacter versatilis]|uniref:Alpha-hydroxy-acid oxidizing protein n=1 Tax=Candidatus Korobacter versatilis TaxID=658062 RepID=A0A932EPN1_9BACT|nr:alpha-hydroxy-acid oxidizing protein [Candidatus Koribacter versatilis]
MSSADVSKQAGLQGKLKNGAERQAEIYVAGVKGLKPRVPTRLDVLEQRAKEVLKPEAYDYVAGSAGSEDTYRANLEAFRRWRIVPHMLHNVEHRDHSIELWNSKLPAPVALAPVGVQGIIHKDAEIGTGRAAASLGVPFTLSTVSSRSIEDVAKAMGDATRWFQLYWAQHPEITASFLARAERAGYSAVLVTLDTTILAWRPRDLDHAYLPFLTAEGLANYYSDPVFCSELKCKPEENRTAAVKLWKSIFSNTRLTWDDIAWLRAHTRLPIILKGIVRGDDAARAVDHGVDGIVVSNHGGRQVDGAIATLEALPGVLEAVGGKMPVLLDSGIRRGADALKALALGAKAVLLGRPYIYGLAVAGEDGVREVVENFVADFDLTMALSGYTGVSELSPAALVRD